MGVRYNRSWRPETQQQGARGLIRFPRMEKFFIDPTIISNLDPYPIFECGRSLSSREERYLLETQPRGWKQRNAREKKVTSNRIGLTPGNRLHSFRNIPPIREAKYGARGVLSYFRSPQAGWREKQLEALLLGGYPRVIGTREAPATSMVRDVVADRLDREIEAHGALVSINKY